MGASEIETVVSYTEALRDVFGNLEQMPSVLAKFLDARVVLHEPDSLPWGGTWVGIDGYMACQEIIHRELRRNANPVLAGVSDGASHIKLTATYYSDGPYVIQRNSDPVPAVELFEVRDGKIIDIDVYLFDASTMLPVG